MHTNADVTSIIGADEMMMGKPCGAGETTMVQD
eukprot:CAMPEP_0185596322 /NCGR_PEP_ID=MMETSP0434-20130131/80687_1 /TAXON_ID=626734 ORGANISM="Favella taraikaensis, Strain Fe Narragansett Bay" /NCGR_SAMPLE_ID=MMETSP0434 /ASSEMBLY_ACC=CAM_ASM_000379 /LENGTH=32 /DNA_ID= /DNA_START= /DNA_END= /DNA_ORIENTATION=